MGLPERRRIKELVEKLPQLGKELRDETGLDLPIELEAEALGRITDMDKLNETLDWMLGLSNSGEFWSEPIAAWKELTGDDLGRGAIQQRIKSWRLTYEPGVPTSVKLVDGVLLHHVNFVDDGMSARLWRADFAAQLEGQLLEGGLRLGERRHIREIQEQVVPRVRADLSAIVGKDLPITVADDFARMPADGRQGALDWLRGWVNSGELWSEVLAAFKEVCRDEMGKEAVAGAVKGLVLRWEAGREAGLALGGGQLTYYYNFIDSPGAHRLFAGDFQRALEGML